MEIRKGKKGGDQITNSHPELWVVSPRSHRKPMANSTILILLGNQGRDRKSGQEEEGVVGLGLTLRWVGPLHTLSTHLTKD